MPSVPSSRPWIARGVVALLLVVLLASAATATVAYTPPQLQPGAVTQPANGSTIVAVQGFHWQGQDDRKKPARLVSAGERANIKWVYDGSKRGANWFYDADPLPNGNILAVNTFREDGRGKTLVYELNPDTKERVWERTFDITDTHDVDLINGDQLLVANMREWDESNQTSNDRLFVYDLSEDEIVWEWYFKDHYPASTDGGTGEDWSHVKDGDWSHVNDVDKIGDGLYMASPRNFDEVIFVDRDTGEIVDRLGTDQDYSTIFEQHNPAYLETEDGEPTVLVADSENNRVVEYTCVGQSSLGDCDWELVWEVGTDQFNWPRDANRLPNGNTLITDSRNHRVVEVTPAGEIVWEAYVPWAPFSAERVAVGNDGVRSPTMTDLGVNGSHDLSGSAGLTAGTGDGSKTFPDWLRANVVGLPLVGGVAADLADAWQAGAQWIKPVWMAPWSFVYLVAAALLALTWAVAEVVYNRDRILDGARGVASRTMR